MFCRKTCTTFRQRGTPGGLEYDRRSVPTCGAPAATLVTERTISATPASSLWVVPLVAVPRPWLITGRSLVYTPRTAQSTALLTIGGVPFQNAGLLMRDVCASLREITLAFEDAAALLSPWRPTWSDAHQINSWPVRIADGATTAASYTWFDLTSVLLWLKWEPRTPDYKSSVI